MGTRASILLLALALDMGGCAMTRHREQVRQGLLTRGLHRDAFLKEWGPPARTFSQLAPEPVYKIDPFTSSWQRPVYEIWEYRDRALCLTFDGVRLVSWERDKSDCTPEPTPERPRRRTTRPPPYPPPP